jgi:hypothetical protein
MSELSSPAIPPRVGPETLANPQPTRVGKPGGPGGRSPLAGAVGGVPPRNQKRGRGARINNPATSGTQDAGKPSANEGGQTGGPGGASPLAGGCGGVPPRNQKRGRGARINNPATSGTQNVGEPKANEGGQSGVEGAQPPPRGFGGCAPTKLKIGDEQPTSAIPPRVGPETLANPRPTRVGKPGGPGGRSPHGGGCGGVPPRNQKRGRGARINNPATSGTQNAGGPSANEGGQTWGARGQSPHGGGLWGVSPHETKRGGEAPALTTPPRVGPKTLVNPKPTGVGKGELKRQRGLRPCLRLAIAMSKARGWRISPASKSKFCSGRLWSFPREGC